MRLMSYYGKRVAVTGASGGLGAALADALEEAGATVDRISRSNAAHGMHPATWAPWKYEMVFLNAGFGMLEYATTPIVTSDFDAMVRVNLIDTIKDAQSALSGGCLHVHVVGSIISVVSSPLYSLYAATKYGLRGWSYGAARELPGRVSISYPNGIRTPYFAHLRGNMDVLASYAAQVDQAQANYDTPDAVAGGILDGIAYGAREIIPTQYSLEWFVRNEEDIRRMWHAGLTQPSLGEFPWWQEVRAHWQSTQPQAVQGG